jgi:hypothetical protein
MAEMARALSRRDVNRSRNDDAFPLVLIDGDTNDVVSARLVGRVSEPGHDPVTIQKTFSFGAIDSHGDLYKVEVWLPQHPDLQRNFRKDHLTGPNIPVRSARTVWTLIESARQSA